MKELTDALGPEVKNREWKTAEIFIQNLKLGWRMFEVSFRSKILTVEEALNLCYV